MLNPLKLTIVDDAPENVRLITKFLGSYPSQINIIGKFTKPEEALEAMKENMPDVVLLDIEMPRMNGFDLLSRLNAENLHVIFITSHDEFAIKAIKCAAIDYILKPFSREELHEALNKAKIKLSLQEKIASKNNSPTLKKDSKEITLAGVNTYLSNHYQEALYLRAIKGGFTMFYMKDGSQSLTTYPLHFYEAKLGDKGFFRSHKSHIINLRHVTGYDSHALITQHADGRELDLAIRRKTLFQQMWQTDSEDINQNRIWA